VLKAVELGLGVSLLPEFVCAESLAQGRVVELFPVSHLTSEEPLFACTRSGELARGDVQKLLTALHA
jgi:DNA-binding transcriptional LysR family regulator